MEKSTCKRCRASFEQHPYDPWPICPVCRNELSAEEVAEWRWDHFADLDKIIGARQKDNKKL